MSLTQSVLVLNGPNLGRLGSRQPEVYGSATLDDLADALTGWAPDGWSTEVRQTDNESQLIGWLHEAVDTRRPVILNPAAFTHYSYGLRDAAVLLPEAGIPLIEVHISNPHAREAFRQHSTISAVASGVIAGFGFDSYRLALSAITG
ncbi:MAG: type II 3-dehydroquinate dehydratase [Mycetocola sp.]